MKAYLQLLTALSLLLGCEEEKKFEPVYDVPVKFEPYLAAFIAEASARGLSYKINNLIVRYDATLTQATCGSCNETTKNNGVQKIISIRSNLICWTNDQELEALIFHELGHCFLGRAHLNDKLPNGDPKSIMIPDNNVLYPPCEYAIDNDPCNKLFKRKYYIDELFNESTPIPDWAK